MICIAQSRDIAVVQQPVVRSDVLLSDLRQNGALLLTMATYDEHSAELSRFVINVFLSCAFD